MDQKENPECHGVQVPDPLLSSEKAIGPGMGTCERAPAPCTLASGPAEQYGIQYHVDSPSGATKPQRGRWGLVASAVNMRWHLQLLLLGQGFLQLEHHFPLAVAPLFQALRTPCQAWGWKQAELCQLSLLDDFIPVSLKRQGYLR
jgi:hypothetical protein